MSSGAASELSGRAFQFIQKFCIIMPMKEYTASQAREHFAEILDEVEQGRSIGITKHGAPVATIQRVDSQVAAPGWAKLEGWSCKIAPGFDEIPEGFEEYV